MIIDHDIHSFLSHTMEAAMHRVNMRGVLELYWEYLHYL